MIEHKDVQIYKYTVTDGMPSMPDSFFLALFNKIMEEGAAMTFYLLAREEDLNAYQFMQWCKSNHFYYVEYKGKPAGFTIVTEIRTGFGYIDIYLFKEHWGTEVTDKTRMQTTEWLLTNEWLSLICFIPTDNEHMVKALHKIKWKDLGILPKSRVDKKNDRLVDQLIGYGSRDMYLEE